VLSWRYI